MRILAIGNSFSQDATRYLNKIADNEGVELTVANLYIGGCPLSTHFANLITGNNVYSLEINGEETGKYVSLLEMLADSQWDYITLQQVSHESINYSTFQPYLNELVAYIRKNSPGAKIVIHQTWAYEQNSYRLCEELNYSEQSEMYRDIKIAYDKAVVDVNADMLIPSGEMFQKLIEKGMSVHRDTFHASLGLGRYALGLLWYVKLSGNSAISNTFSDFDEEISEELVQQIKQVIKEYER